MLASCVSAFGVTQHQSRGGRWVAPQAL